MFRCTTKGCSKELGEGKFGIVVKLGCDCDVCSSGETCNYSHSQVVAFKRLKDNSKLNDFIEEARISWILGGEKSHTNIVKMFGISLYPEDEENNNNKFGMVTEDEENNNNKFGMVTELCEQGNLNAYLKRALLDDNDKKIYGRYYRWYDTYT